MVAKAIRLYHTIKYLKLKQVVWRIIYVLPRFISPKRKCPETTSVTFTGISKTGISKDYDNYIFLNEAHQVSIVGWDNSSLSKLWRYNLHYFDYLRQDGQQIELIEIQRKTIENWIVIQLLLE